MTAPLVQATGRRKRAVARVRVRPGEGRVVINGRDIEDYFPSPTHRSHATEALRVTDTGSVYDVDATITGGGLTGQAGALSLGIARSLESLDGDPADADGPRRIGDEQIVGVERSLHAIQRGELLAVRSATHDHVTIGDGVQIKRV